MARISIACCLWDANAHSQPFSRCYDESWVEKLYRGFKRNLTREFAFVCFVDRLRDFSEGIHQTTLVRQPPNYGSLIEPFRLPGPLIVCGLDMVILKNIDHLADYCETATEIAAPRDPYKPEQLINPIVLAPAKHEHIIDRWGGENDMQWLRKFPWKPMDDLWPGHARSLKAHKIRDCGPGDARIIYMHGSPKAPELMHLNWVKQHWI